MIDFRHRAAFEAFHTDEAVVTGSRRENAAERALSVSVRCCVLVGDYIDTGDGVSGMQAARSVRIEISKSNWPDHSAPQAGDVWEVADIGTVKAVDKPLETESTYVIDGVLHD